MISVIIPVFNSSTFLKKCINSILKQTYKNVEIILFNDGSTDNTAEICYELQKVHNQIKYFENKINEGIEKTRIKGLKFARGNYIFLLMLMIF